MAGTTAGLIAIFIHSVTLALMFVAIRHLTNQTRYFRSISEIVDSWRQAVSPGEKLLIFALVIVPYVILRGIWAAFFAWAVAGFGAVAAIAGHDLPGVLREIRPILRDFYRFVQELLTSTG